MKKWISVILVAAICCCLPFQCSALEKEETQSLVVDEINYQALLDEDQDSSILSDYSITSYIGEYNQEVRCYQKPEYDLHNDAMSTDDMRELLIALGMDKDVVYSYSEEKLEEFREAKTITVESAYIKTSQDGTVSYHQKDEVLAELATRRGTESDEYRDSLMNLRVAWTGGGGNPDGDLFTVTASWLTQPGEGWEDIIGVSIKGYTTNAPTMNGWYRYQYGSDYKYYFYDEHDPDTYQTPSNDNYEGAAIVMDLGGVRPGMKIYMEVYAYPLYPELTTNSKVYGTYLHQISKLAFTPSLTLPTDIFDNKAKGLGWLANIISVGVEIQEDYEPRTAQCNFQYTP